MQPLQFVPLRRLLLRRYFFKLILGGGGEFCFDRNVDTADASKRTGGAVAVLGNAAAGLVRRSRETMRLVGAGGKGAAPLWLDTPYIGFHPWSSAEHKCKEQQECDKMASGVLERDSMHGAYITETLHK